jgi:hypothetical protein
VIRKDFFYIIFISITDGGSINILHERKPSESDMQKLMPQNAANLSGRNPEKH